MTRAPRRTRAPAVRLLDGLPRAPRDLLVAAHVDHLSPPEIAALLGLDEAAIPARLAAAERALAQRMATLPEWQGQTITMALTGFAQQTTPSPQAVRRVLAGVRGRPPRRRWILPVAGLAAAAALSLLVVRLAPSTSGGSVTSPAPSHTASMAAAPTAVAPSASLDLALLSPDTPEQLAVDEDIQLLYQGDGSCSGTRRAPRIAWNSGSIDVTVTPERGIDMQVHTEEAVVQVTGTRFQVLRDALGTQVTVHRGSVRVQCLSGIEGGPTGAVERHLQVDQALRCLPVRDARWLARALALSQAHADPAVVLQAARAGLQVAGVDSDYRGELVWAELQSLEALGQPGHALTATQACLDEPARCLGRDQSRVTDLHRNAARLAFASGGCSAAIPHLAAIEAQGSATDRFALARCLENTDPSRACQLLGALDAPGGAGSLASAIQAMRERLGARCTPTEP